MQNYEVYISDLLVLHDCVIIPDFGGFICNYRSAELDEVSGKFIPPLKTVLFNYKLRNNDGLLVNHIATQENISYNEALQRVEVFVNDIKTRMRMYGHVALGEMGLFRLDAQCNMVFEATGANFLADTWGMMPMQVDVPKGKRSSARMVEMTQRMVKYSAVAAVLVGLFILVNNVMNTHDVQTFTDVNQSSITSFDTKASVPYVSPESDYVDYNPME